MKADKDSPRLDAPILGYYIVGETFEALIKMAEKKKLKIGDVVTYHGEKYEYTNVVQWGIYIRPAFKKVERIA